MSEFIVGDRVTFHGINYENRPGLCAIVVDTDRWNKRIFVRFDEGLWSTEGTWFGAHLFRRIKPKEPDWRV